MATTQLRGNDVHTIGELPLIGTEPPAFTLTGRDLADVSLEQYLGQRVVLNIFPSIDTGTCAMSVRTFNERAAGLHNTTVLCVSNDLPFALGRFCGAEGLDDVVPTSAFRSTFGEDYGVTLVDGPLAGLLSRSVVVIDERGEIVHTELVPEISTEPDYDLALAALSGV